MILIITALYAEVCYAECRILCYAMCHYAEWRNGIAPLSCVVIFMIYANCRYAECRYTECRGVCVVTATQIRR